MLRSLDIWTQRDRPALEAPALHTLRLIARQSWCHYVTRLRSDHCLASSLKLATRCPVRGCWPSCLLLLNQYQYFARSVFTARRNARIVSAVLATAIPSVCPSVRPSVTRRYSVETTARSTAQFALSDSKICLVLQKPKKYFPGTTPSPWNLASISPTPSS